MLVNKRQGIVLGGRWLGAHALGHRSVSSFDFLSILPAHCEVNCSVQPWSPFHRKPTSPRLWAQINSSYKLFISDGLATVTKVNDDIIFFFHFCTKYYHYNFKHEKCGRGFKFRSNSKIPHNLFQSLIEVFMAYSYP